VYDYDTIRYAKRKTDNCQRPACLSFVSIYISVILFYYLYMYMHAWHHCVCDELQLSYQYSE